MGKGGVYYRSIGAGVESEVVGVVIRTRVRVTRAYSQAGEGWAEGDLWQARQLERIYICGGRRCGRGVQVVNRKGTLEGRDGNATLKGFHQGCQRRGLLPGTDGPFHVGT